MENESIYYTKEEIEPVVLADILWKLCEQSYDQGSPWSKQQFLEDLALTNSYYNLMKSENQFIGFVSHHQIFDEIELTHMVIDKEYQNRKFGSQLLDRLLKVAKSTEIHQLFLEVRESNNSARKLYSKFGFEEIHIRKKYYKNPTEDALIMCLNLRK